MQRILHLILASGFTLSLASCVSPPTTSGSGAPSAGIPSPSGSAPSAGIPGGTGLPSPVGTGLPSPIPSSGIPGGSTSGSPTGSPSGSPNGSPNGSPDGSPDGSEDGSATADGNQSDLPSWEPATSGGDGSESSDEGTLGDGQFGSVFTDADLEDLEATLEEAIGTFDGEILREQENVRDKTGNVGSAGGQSSVEVLAGVGEFERAGGAPGQTGNSAGGGDAGEKIFDDGPPPSPDDDVVARQIREAAMREQDPEQRKILWEEYERYKGGS